LETLKDVSCKSKVTKWNLVAGQEMLHDFCIDIFSSDDPLICIWTTENPPDLEEAIRKNLQLSAFYAIDNVNIYNKEQIYSLLFPNGFVKGKWNYVLASIDEDAANLYTETNGNAGVFSGWMNGTDIDELTLDVESEFLGI
jgi:hypothetical protein